MNGLYMNERDEARSTTRETVAIGRDYRQSVLLWLHLVRAYQRVAREEAQLLASYGLTVAQFDMLSRLATEPGLSQQALAERLLVTKGNVAGILDRLEAAGLVERRSNSTDRRVHQIYLTPAGREAFERAAPALEETISDQLDVLTREEQLTLLRLAAKLDRTLRR